MRFQRRSSSIVRALQEGLIEACERMDVPLEALEWLVTSKGHDTWTAIGQVVIDRWRADQSKPQQREAAGGHPFQGTPIGNPQNVIEVPNLDAIALTALTEKHCNLTFLGDDYRCWDFWKGFDGKPIRGRGRRFEFLTWAPRWEQEVSSDEVREYFRTRGFSGNAGPFTAFVKEKKPIGYCASIPDNSGCLRGYGGCLDAPYSYFGGYSSGNSRKLGITSVYERPASTEAERRGERTPEKWRGNWTFVAFRELSA